MGMDNLVDGGSVRGAAAEPHEAGGAGAGPAARVQESSSWEDWLRVFDTMDRHAEAQAQLQMQLEVSGVGG